MASHYLQFSEVIPQLTPPEETWLRHQLEVVFVFGPDEYGENLPDELDSNDADWHGCRAYRDLEGYDPQDDGDGVGFAFAFHDDPQDPDIGRHLWVYAEEGGSIERLAHLVQKFLRAFRPSDSWSLTYATTCSRPYAGEFSGGGLFVTAENIKSQNAYEFIDQERQAHERQPISQSSPTHLRPQ